MSMKSISSTPAQGAVLGILIALSLSHFLNDAIQALIPSIYPILKHSFGLTFTQIGLITLTFQMTASILQPLVGLYTDRRPLPYSLPIGMGMTLVGLVLLALANSFPKVLFAAALVGMGSAIFHPESSRIARLASGGRKGFAQSVFQVGGNTGTAVSPLLAAWIIVAHGQRAILWFTLLAFVGIVLLARVSVWYRHHLSQRVERTHASAFVHTHSWQTIAWAMLVLLALVFSKYFYLSCMTSYYTFYLIGKFGLSVPQAQVQLFLFLFAVAAGTILGGPIGDRFGRKLVIWISILGAAPFALLLPHANLFWSGVLAVCVGLILASAMSAILVYATELVPGKGGLVSGLFFGLAFGMGGIGSAVLGKLADVTSMNHVFAVCAFLPLLGLLAIFLPNITEPALEGSPSHSHPAGRGST